MAYAESTIGGSSGGQFRVWVRSIRTHKGSAAENFEDWRAEGGINRVVSGSRIWNLNNNNTYHIQLGINGMAASGNFTYDAPSGWTGGLKSWGTGTTRAHRNGSGGGFGFTSRTDVNMQNSPYLTSGWVTAGENVDTVNRYGDIDAISPSAAAGVTDETPSMSIDWHKYAGRATLWFRLDQINNADTTYRFTNVSQDPFIWSGFQTWVQQSMVNTNSTQLYIYYGDDLDSNGSIDRWDDPNLRTLTIQNDLGQANPTFSDFDYLDANATTVAVTGDDQILIQNKSDLEVTVAAADKATANKNANMTSYNFSIGGYSQSEPWSNTLDVFKDIGIVADVSGQQNLSVRAIDSRGNGTTVSKNVTVLPYSSPGFYAALDVNYENDFDIGDGLAIDLFNDEVLGSISPMTHLGSDINEVPSPAGLRFDMAVDTGSFTGTWTNIAFTQEAGTGYIKVNPATLASAIESKYNTMAAGLSVEPNTVRWFILFEITDALETQYFTATIDVGRPFFRIGADGRLYYKEIEFFQTFSGDSSIYYPATLAGSTAGTWALETPPAARTGGWVMFRNTSQALNDECYIDTYVPAGTYSVSFLFDQATTGGLVELNLDDQIIFSSNYNTAGAAGTNTGTTGNINFLDGATYRMYVRVTGNTGGSSVNSCRLLGIRFNRIGFTP